MEFFANLHPKFVHFSIALFSIYILLEFFYFFYSKEWLNKTVHLILILGIFLTIGTVLTGNQAEKSVIEIIENKAAHVKEVLEEHEEYGTLVLWLFAAIAVFRTYILLKKKMTKKTQVILLLLAAIGGYLIFEAGEYGGELVYRHGVGTELFKEKYLNE
ncbi:MAG: DUF2231 domain-containing protein [Melioribacteraceae bacterium]|jgi:uncharacterized membrane protein|nr:DUF2231 domain-containing protein [Melioribacteraceae bacterium]